MFLFPNLITWNHRISMSVIPPNLHNLNDRNISKTYVPVTQISLMKNKERGSMVSHHVKLIV